jgi:thiamine pyrophosphokinase
VVAADSGLILAEAAGLKPDWIVGDMDSLGDENRLSCYPKENIIFYPAEKDFTDTEIAFDLLIEKGCDNIWIIGGGGGRMDHLFGIRDLFERKRFPQRWISANEDIYCIDGKEIKHNTLKLNLKSGDLVSVFLLGGGPWKAERKGLKWPLNNVHWERGLYGLSNIVIIEEIEIIVKEGRFLIIIGGICRQLL